jgi:YidC/Oxa1 family membrane protein insertase
MPILANVIQEAFSPLISLFESIMVFIHNDVVGGSWGLAIVGLTVLIRAVLVPLTYRQLKAMQEMQKLAPQLSALKEKYKDDTERQRQEVMNLYKEHGVNPFASCLPMLMQMPVFISLFYMLRTDLKKHICGPALTKAGFVTTKQIEKVACNQVAPHSAKFLFLPDITNKATGLTLVLLIALYVGSQVGSTLIATASADPNQRRMMLLIPVVFVFFLYRYPAGLLVYWITTNLWTVGQQYLIRRHMASSEDKDENGEPVLAAPAPAKPSGSLRTALAGAMGINSTSAEESRASGPVVAPPPPPRKKKKRSGRRR